MKISLLKSLAIAGALLGGGCAQTSSPVATTEMQSNIDVGAPVWISKPNSDREIYEMIGAIDPADSNHLLACTTVFSKTTNARSNIIYASFDGGKTWTPTFEDSATVFTGDPACTYGFNGVAYYAGLPIYGGPHLTSSEHIYKSLDYGKTWHLIVTRPFQDREYLTVDHTNSRYRGNVYFYGDGIGGKLGSRPDGWDIFRIENDKLSEPAISPESAQFHSMNASDGVIALDGSLVVPFDGSPVQPADAGFQFRILRSSDGGKTISPSVLIGPDCKSGGTLGSPAAVDKSSGPFRGRVYAAYTLDSHERCTVAVVHSDDNGRTWSKAAQLHESNFRRGFPLAPDQSETALAVDSRGIVGISWYDTRDDVAGHAYKLRFAASYDGGESFTPSVPVSQFPEDIAGSSQFIFGADAASGGATSSHHSGTNDALVSDAGPDWMTVRTPGDTRSMVVDAQNVFHPFWYDNRTGIPQLYTAPVRVVGQAWRNGDASLDALHDVTNRVSLRYAATNFDTASSTVTLSVTVVNRSNAPIQGPIKMRMLWVDSSMGSPVALDALNHFSGPGAIWDFTNALDGGQLKPWTESRPITITLRLDDFDTSRLKYPAVEFGSRVYAAK